MVDPSSLDDIGSLIGDFGGGKPSEGDQYDKAPIVSEDDPSCRTTGVTDEGIIKSAKWKSIISAAVMAYNVANSLRMAKLQRDLREEFLRARRGAPALLQRALQAARDRSYQGGAGTARVACGTRRN